MIYFSDFGTPTPTPSVAIAATEFDSPTSTGIVDVTADLGGLTPKAALVIGSYHNAANGNSETAGLAMEIRAFVADWIVGTATSAQDNVGNTNTHRGQFANPYSSGSVDTVTRVNVPDGAGTAAVIGKSGSTAVEFIPNGVRINYTTVDTVARRGIIVFFAGDDLTAEVGRIDLTSNGTTDVTSVGFEPDAVFVFGNGAGSDVSAVSMSVSFGIGVNGGGQRCVSWGEADNKSAAQPFMRIDNNAILRELNGSDGSTVNSATIGSFDSAGFSITTTGTATETYEYLALAFGGKSVSLFGFDTPTSTGNQSYESPGFQPQAAFVVGTNLEAENTAPSGTNDLYGGLSIGVATGSEQWCGQWRYDPGSDPTDCATLVRTGFGTPSHAAMSACLGSLTFDSSGFDINWSAVQGSAKKGFALCVQ